MICHSVMARSIDPHRQDAITALMFDGVSAR